MKRLTGIVLVIIVTVSISGCRGRVKEDVVPLEELPKEYETQQVEEVVEETTKEASYSTESTEEVEGTTELDSTSIFELIYPMEYCSELNIIETPDNGLKISYMSDEPLWDETEFAT